MVTRVEGPCGYKGRGSDMAVSMSLSMVMVD